MSPTSPAYSSGAPGAGRDAPNLPLPVTGLPAQQLTQARDSANPAASSADEQLQEARREGRKAEHLGSREAGQWRRARPAARRRNAGQQLEQPTMEDLDPLRTRVSSQQQNAS